MRKATFYFKCILRGESGGESYANCKLRAPNSKLLQDTIRHISAHTTQKCRGRQLIYQSICYPCCPCYPSRPTILPLTESRVVEPAFQRQSIDSGNNQLLFDPYAQSTYNYRVFYSKFKTVCILLVDDSNCRCEDFDSSPILERMCSHVVGPFEDSSTGHRY